MCHVETIQSQHLSGQWVQKLCQLAYREGKVLVHTIVCCLPRRDGSTECRILERCVIRLLDKLEGNAADRTIVMEPLSLTDLEAVDTQPQPLP